MHTAYIIIFMHACMHVHSLLCTPHSLSHSLSLSFALYRSLCLSFPGSLSLSVFMCTSPPPNPPLPSRAFTYYLSDDVDAAEGSNVRVGTLIKFTATHCCNTLQHTATFCNA